MDIKEETKIELAEMLIEKKPHLATRYLKVLNYPAKEETEKYISQMNKGELEEKLDSLEIDRKDAKTKADLIELLNDNE